MKTIYEHRYKNQHYDMLNMWIIYPIALILFYNKKIDMLASVLWIATIVGLIYYLAKLRKPENIYYIKIDTEEKKIKKVEYDKNVKSS